MNTRNPNELPAALARRVDDVRNDSPAESVVDAAQARLMQRVSQARAPRSRRALGGWAVAAASACLVLAISVVPLLDNPTGIAFAQVQQHFSTFRTLVISMQQRLGGGIEQNTTVLVAADGRTRVDVGDQLSVVIDPAQGRGMNLLHGPKQAVQFGFEPGESLQGSDALQWLQQIREFQGEAERLPEPREIDGVEAWGWRLQLDAMDVTLWATEDGLPVSMQLDRGAQLDMDFSFDFDAPIDESQWNTTPPAGYSEMTGAEAHESAEKPAHH